MVTLLYDDGHAEIHPELNQSDIEPFLEQTITLLTPEEEFICEMMGLLPYQQEPLSPFTEAM